MPVVNQFSEHLRLKEPCGFSQRVESIYAETLSWMRKEPHMDGFDTALGKPNLTDNSPYGVAQQFNRYFQPHFIFFFPTAHLLISLIS